MATERNNLGGVWLAKGELDKAILCCEQALASDIKTYGDEHPKVATERSNLGEVWRQKGALENAIHCHELALASDLKTYGNDHPVVTKHRYNLAIVNHEQALASDLKTYGEGRPQVAIQYLHLGLAWLAIGELDKAINYFESAMTIFEKKLGDDHPYTRTVRNSLKLMHQEIG